MGGASVLQMIMKYRWLKSLAAFVAAIVLSFVCAAPAFAASGSLKVVSQEGTHSYQAYKLFACDVNADGSVSNVSTAGCMPADFYADAFTSSNAQEMAEEVSRQVNGPQASSYAAALSRRVVAHGSGAAVQEFNTDTTVTLSTGVYLLVSHDAQPILVTIGSSLVEVNEKSTLPSVSKEVASFAGGDNSAASASFGQSATAGFSQRLAYRVTGTLPSNYEAFESYYYAFVDTPGKGIVIDSASVVVSLIDDQGSEQILSGGYTVSFDQGVLRVAFDNLKQSVPNAGCGSKIVLSYSAALDLDNASYGFEQGNSNSAHIEYSQSPSYNEKGTSKSSSTKAYSLVLALTKVDAQDEQKLLPGASFELKDAQGNCVSGVTDDAGYLRIAGVAPGKYQLTETAAPSGYSCLNRPITVEITVDPDTLTLSVFTTSDYAKVTQVDAGKGVMSISVQNSQHSSGIFSRTGDVVAKALLALLAFAVVASATIAVVSARKSCRRNEGTMKE